MKVVILMGGRGERFLGAGYTVPKPLIEVDGMTVIEHIVRNFDPEDKFVFGVNEDDLQRTPIRPLLERIVSRGTIVPIPYLPEGPVASVIRLLPYIQSEEEVIVNYCDFSWVWDYKEFKRRVRETNCDAAVVCYHGFHPHLLGPNTYATLVAEGEWMMEIREKYSWHISKTEDWTSSGTYYFKKGQYVRRYSQAIQARAELKIAGEYYVSQLSQLMREDGLGILVYEIPFMLQWGTPEDVEHYRYWSGYFRALARRSREPRPHAMTVLILMAGAGTRFARAGYDIPKPFIPVDDLPMVTRATQSLPQGTRYLFISRHGLEHSAMETQLTALFSPSDIVRIPEVTEGQACTALLAKKKLSPEEPLLIGACDHLILWDEERFERVTAPDAPIDALIFTFRGNLDLCRHPERYGWVQTDGSTRALYVSVKVPLSETPTKDHVVVGAFWFRKAQHFIEHAERMIQEERRIHNEFYIDDCMNGLIRDGLGVHVFEVEYYASLGTPDDLRTYQYWEQFFRQTPFHPYHG